MYAELIDPDLPGYRLASAPAGPLPGIFSNAWQEAAGQAGTFPTFTCDATTAAAAGAGNGQEVSIDAAAYLIRESQPRDGGGVTFILECI
ncbi:hypothetical protein ACJJID_00235 (plasmid) [Microbulbifer sp. CnH-101-G]|uniref:hypothetical protein n=1 Tax=Microbulbifer sp. CnH-101-G TaxID=3243393 RepID=UPI004039F3EA